jgi:hypothetical protein
MFEKPDKNNVIFDDDDYEEHNQKYNRVKSYSFSRGRVIC